jgi:aerobic C4-dicarboxylate transport protein
MDPTMKKIKWYRQLYIQVFIAILLGIVLGHFFPKLAIQMKPLADGFIKLIRMMIGPIIFTTVISGIASMKDIHEVGRVGLKALIYFEVMTTLALLIGLFVAHIMQPGSGFHVDLHTLDTTKVAHITASGEQLNLVDFILNIIPDTIMGAFTQSEILPVLFLSILFGFGILHSQTHLKSLRMNIDEFTKLLFTVIEFIMKLAPLGAFGAMAYTISLHGIYSLLPLGKVLACMYLTGLMFVLIILGSVARIAGFSILRFIAYIKEELLIVLGTSSSETVLPRMMLKMEQLGCGKAIVGLVLPAGYTFNLDGTCIYLTIASLFIAQAFHIDLTISQVLLLFIVFLLTSKGAAAVSGGGFIVLASTLSIVHFLPMEGVVLLLGIDRLMSDARSLVNLIGNGVATLVIAKWEGDYLKDKRR